jgi:hypothetical protein
MCTTRSDLERAGSSAPPGMGEVACWMGVRIMIVPGCGKADTPLALMEPRSGSSISRIFFQIFLGPIWAKWDSALVHAVMAVSSGREAGAAAAAAQCRLQPQGRCSTHPGALRVGFPRPGCRADGSRVA